MTVGALLLIVAGLRRHYFDRCPISSIESRRKLHLSRRVGGTYDSGVAVGLVVTIDARWKCPVSQEVLRAERYGPVSATLPVAMT